MIIKKFKNGKIKLQTEKKYDYDCNNIIDENIYHNDIFMQNLNIDTIDGYFYIIDSNKQIVYDYFNSYFIQNPLKSLLDTLDSEKTIYLYPSDIDFNDYLKQYDEEGDF